MRPIRPIVLGLTLLGAGSAVSCAGDETTAPSSAMTDRTGVQPPSAIVVTNAAELATALSPANAGRHIRVRAGTYAVSTPLTVPDGATVEGEGEMQFDGARMPAGFGAGPHTTLTMSENVPGNMLTLGNGATIRRLEIADLAGRPGSVVAVLSREPGDRVSATIVESVILTPNPEAPGPDGPTGVGLLVLSRNASLGADPAPDQGAAITAQMVRSVIRSPAGGPGVFAFNFAAFGKVSVTLRRNVIGGGMIANGGVSRPDAVHDAKVRVESLHNLYRDDRADACAAPRPGWNLTGGSGPPAPLPVGGTARNSLIVRSENDRIEGFTIGVLGTGARRFFAAPTAGASDHNSVNLKLLGSRISTPTCGGAPFVADLNLTGAFAGEDGLTAGEGNSLRAVIRDVTGSGPRFNAYSHSTGPSGPQAPALQGSNRIEIVGTPAAFARRNRNIDPGPGAEYFSGAVP